MLAVGVDIGGTKIDLVLADTTGAIRAEQRIATQAHTGPSAVLDRMADEIRALLAQADGPLAGVGIGCPGQVDPASGVVRTAVNLGWSEVALRDELARRLAPDLRLAVNNDVNAAALGERTFGAAPGCRDLVYLAIGTGLGGGALVNGRIVNGATGTAMEVGHLSFDPAGRACRCGQRGCAEMYISGIGLMAGVAAHRADYPTTLPPDACPAAILDAARAGDPLAATVIAEAAEWLGQVMACCVSLFNPAMIVLGGGLGLAAADLLLEPARAALRRRVLPNVIDAVTVVVSRLDRIALGAACLAFERVDPNAPHV